MINSYIDGMPWKIWTDVTPEEEERLIQRAADLVSNYEMETPALLVLNMIKPLVYVGGEMGRFFIAPLLPFLNHKADAFIHTFEQRKNIDKLIEIIEEKISIKDENKRKIIDSNKDKKIEGKTQS